MHKICAFCLFSLIFPVSAIVVQDYVTAEAAPSAAGLDLNWDYVYNYKGSSAVAVGGGWLLTAGHVADDGGNGSLTIGGIVYTQQAIVPHPSADLALVRYDKPLPGYYDLYTGDTPAITNQLLMVGYGTTGTVSSSFWTGSDSGRGTKRWGSQRINSTNSGGDEFVMMFNTFSTPYEAGAGSGDSGGGVFFKDADDIWKLAGINVSIGAGGSGLNRINAMSMPYYADWIAAETIPEPAAIGLMGFGTVGLFLARTKRRRKLVGRSLFPIRGDDPACDLVLTKVEDIGAEAVDSLAWLKQAQTYLLTAWTNIHGRYKILDMMFWNHMVVAHERNVTRKKEIQMRLLPAWGKVHEWYKGLDKIFWTHMVAIHERRMMRKKAIKLALKKKAINSFDAFLARIMK